MPRGGRFLRGMIPISVPIFPKIPISTYCYHRLPFPSRSQPFIISMLKFLIKCTKMFKANKICVVTYSITGQI